MCERGGDSGDHRVLRTGLAAAAGARGEWGRAARPLGAAYRMWQPLGTVVWANRRAAYDELVERTRLALGPRFETAWADGLRLSSQEAAAEGISAAPAAAVEGAPREDGRVGRLTPRERDVAGMIARGLTSPRIAELLVISERTVDAHADNIRAKLGLHSRAEIAAWAVEHGLTRDPR
jgi:DNA-binding NarL/FixJ family response regulator